GGPVEKVATGVDSPIGFSPDGNRYAYVVEDVSSGKSELRVSSLIGESHITLSAKLYPDSYTVDGPVWSPDGRLIATTYGSSREGVHYDVRVIDASTGHDRALTERHWGHVLGISWLPDNSGLVVNGKERGSDLYHQLFYVDPNSGERRILVSPDSRFDYRGRPSVSKESGVILGVYGRNSTSFWFNSAEAPDRFQKYDSRLPMQGYEGLSWLGSSKLVFTSRMNGSEHLWVTDLNGKDYQLTNTGSNNRYPHATPDGRYVVFSSDWQGPTHVYRIDIDGSNQIELSQGYNDTDPQVSPDGRWVVFTSEYGNLRTLWRVPIDGGDPVQLTTKWAESPVISPDGRWIACISGDESKSDRSIAIIPFDGGEPVNFVSPKSRGYSRYYRYFHWSPDSSGIDYIALANGAANIW
ncbi:MAG: hypothetical protein EBZ36_17355, partial [Acidobacteria bacterium]|nr:hypothetical protein [Acidobacteriota bacterium]